MIELSQSAAFLAALKSARRVLLTGPMDPDGDSLGACLALARGLAGLVDGKIDVAGTPAFRYAWMPGADLLASGSALLAVLAVGLVVGLTNALLVAQFALSPFMVPLAVMSILTGIALYYTQGIPVYGVLDSFVEGVGRGQIAGIPVILLIALAILAACVVLQRLTVFGRHVYAVGSDERAARLSGVLTRRVLIITCALAGVLAALTR